MMLMVRKGPRGFNSDRVRGRDGRRLIEALLPFALVFSLVAAARAGGTLYWEIPTQSGLLKGDARGVAFGPNAEILLAHKLELVYDTEQPFIWCMTLDRHGALFAGTGHEGKVFRIPPKGAGTLLFDAAELDVTALAVDPAGNVYAGTSPGGKVYRIAPDGKSSVFFDPDDTYIWAMAFREGALYLATGSKGRVYKVEGTGQGRVFCETRESNVVAIAFDAKGNLIAGTDPSGLILRIDGDAKAFALFDSPLKEIHSLEVAADGNIYALGISESSAGSSAAPSLGSPGGRSSGPTAMAASPGVSVTITSVEPATTSLGSEISSLNFSSAIYRIAPSGGVESIWKSSDTTAFCIAAESQDRIWAGTNDKGRIYQIDGRGEFTVAGQSGEGQVSEVVRGDGLFMATSNLGKIYRMSVEPSASGEYDSPVFDARFVSQWGSVSWRERAARVELRTRSGNTDSPDATWSDWSAPVTNGARVGSPPGRFVQYRLRLAPAGPGQAAVEGIRVAYLPENVKPQITSFEILQPSVALQEVPQPAPDPGIFTAGLDPQAFGFSVNTPPRKVFQRGARSLQWTASDPNGDSLNFQLLYRSVNEDRWQPLARNITNNWFTIDADVLPDSRYFFKLIASDAPNNPAGRAAMSERISDLTEIDTTPPSVRAESPLITRRHVQVDYVAEDSTSNVSRAEVSIDGGAWQSIFPVDGMADSRVERFSIQADFDAPGEHSIALRVYDTNANIGSHRSSLKVL